MDGERRRAGYLQPSEWRWGTGHGYYTLSIESRQPAARRSSDTIFDCRALAVSLSNLSSSGVELLECCIGSLLVDVGVVILLLEAMLSD